MKAIPNGAMPRQIIVVQPALPSYRIDFFDRLSRHYGERFKVFFSPTDMGALSNNVETPPWGVSLELIKGPVAGLYWQPGVAGLALNRHDVLVLSGNPRFLSTVLLLLKAKLVGAKVIWWGHHWSSTSRAWRYWIRRLPMKLADMLLFYTDEEVNAYRARKGQASKPLTSALNNGINTDPIIKLRKPYAPEDREHALLFIGRITLKSGLKIAIQAISDMGEHAPHLHIIGDGDEKENLVKMGRQLGLAHKLTWHSSTTDESAIANIANRCKAFIYPGDVGLSLIHAMAYGLPSIVHDDPLQHMPESTAFFSAKAGASFKRGDRNSLRIAIANLTESPLLLIDYSDRSIKKVCDNFNTRSMSSRFINAVNIVQ